MTTIETPKLENTIQIKEQEQKVTALEAELKLTKDALIEKEKLLTEIAIKNQPENLIKDMMDADQRIDGVIIKYLYKLPELEYDFTIGKLNFHRVFLGDGRYEVKKLS